MGATFDSYKLNRKSNNGLCILALIWGMLIAALFAVCNIYQKGEIEIIRCSIIDADTIEIPDWTPIE